MVKSYSIKSIKFTFRISFNGSRSGGVIEKSQLSKLLVLLVLFDFHVINKAGKKSFFDNVKIVSIISILNDSVIFVEFLDFKGITNDLSFLWVDILKNKATFHELKYLLILNIVFFYFIGNPIFLYLIKLSKDLS